MAMWDIHGFEHISDITKYHPDIWDRQVMMDVLAGNHVEPYVLGNIVTRFELRARYNPDRQYEIYIFTGEDIEIKDLNQWAESNPQTLVDWIRTNHYKVILDHRNNKTTIT